MHTSQFHHRELENGKRKTQTHSTKECKYIYLFNLYKNHNYMAAPQSDPVTLSAFEASKRLTIIKVYKIILTFTKRNVIKSYLKT